MKFAAGAFRQTKLADDARPRRPRAAATWRAKVDEDVDGGPSVAARTAAGVRPAPTQRSM